MHRSGVKFNKCGKYFPSRIKSFLIRCFFAIWHKALQKGVQTGVVWTFGDVTTVPCCPPCVGGGSGSTARAYWIIVVHRCVVLTQFTHGLADTHSKQMIVYSVQHMCECIKLQRDLKDKFDHH